MKESEIIAQFMHDRVSPEHVLIDSGDDAAVVRMPAGHEVVLSIDTFVSGQHFFPQMPMEAIGYRCIVAALSDLTAMGAHAQALLVSLTMPEVEPTKVAALKAGMWRAADAYQVPIVGGDLTRGPLSISVQVTGSVQAQYALCQGGAKIGQQVWLTGQVGAAAWAISQYPHASEAIMSPFYYPSTPLAFGQALAGQVTSATDVSDGLSVDLKRLVGEYGVFIEQAALPIARHITQDHLKYALDGGDDYGLAFLAEPKDHAKIIALAQDFECCVSCIGEVIAQPGLWVNAEQERQLWLGSGYEAWS